MHPAVTAHRVQFEATDEMLIEHSRSGNVQAFEELFQRYSPVLLNYLFFMNRNPQACGSLLIETFLYFYGRLARYSFRDSSSAELFKAANTVLNRAAPVPVDDESPWRAVPLFDRSLLVLTRRCGFSMGAVSRILGQDTIKLMERINILEAEGFREIDWPVNELQARDYVSELRSRMQAMGQDHHQKTWLAIILCLTLVLFFALGFFFFRAPVPQNDKPVLLEIPRSESRPGTSAKNVLIQELQIDRAAFFKPEEGFAEEKLVFIPGKGKVLALDYELFRVPASIGIRFRLKTTDLSRFTRLSAVIRGDEEYGIPDGIFIEFRKGGASVWRQKLRGLKNQWVPFDFSLGFSAGQVVDSLVILIDEQVSGPAKSGRIYIDQLLLTPRKA